MSVNPARIQSEDPVRWTGFGEALKAYRRAARLTQEELADRSRLSVKTIGALERGVNGSPRRETLQQLIYGLSLSPQESMSLEAVARSTRRATFSGQSAASDEGEVSGSVGRAAELAVIQRHLGRHAPRVLFIDGEPGIGKTHLLGEAMAMARASGFGVIAGGCRRHSGQEPYAPLPSAISRYLRGLSPSRACAALEGCAWLAYLLPELVDEGLLTPPKLAMDSKQERRLIFQAVARFLANIAGPAGVALALDDLQWASADALELVVTLVSGTFGRELRVIAAYRTRAIDARGPLQDALADLAQAGLAQSMQLGPLGLAEAEELLGHVLTQPLSAHEAREVVRKTAGVPFFIMSWAQDLEIQPRMRAGTVDVPWSIIQSVRQRVAALPGNGAHLLEAAAVVGRHVPLHVLRAHAERMAIDAAEVQAVIDIACRERLLDYDDMDGVYFTHDLVREAIEACLTPQQRARFHLWTGEALEAELFRGEPEELAHHYGRGGNREKAVRYLEFAAERAMAVCANQEAALAFGELARQLDALGRQMEAAHAREREGIALMGAAQYDDALASFERAAQVYMETRDVERLAGAMAKIGEAHAQRGTANQGIERLHRALESFTPAGPSHRALAALYLALAWLTNITGRYHTALEMAERAADFATLAGDAEILAQANMRRGHLLLMLVRIDEGLRFFQETLPLLDARHDARSLRFALNNIGWIHEALGKFAVDKEYTDRALDAALRLGDPAVIAYMWSNHGSPAFNIGDWTHARADFERGLALMRGLKPTLVSASWASAWSPLLLGQLNIAEGRSEEGEALLAEAIRCAGQNSDLQALRWANSVLAERDALLGDPSSAVARLEPLLDTPEERVIDVVFLLPLLAWAYAEQDHCEKALTVVGEAIERATARRLLPALASALRVRALVRLKQEREDLARADLAEALTLDQEMRFPYDKAKTLYRLGLVEVAARRHDRASDYFAAAASILQGLGEHLYFEQVQVAINAITQRQ